MGHAPEGQRPSAHQAAEPRVALAMQDRLLDLRFLNINIPRLTARQPIGAIKTGSSPVVTEPHLQTRGNGNYDDRRMNRFDVLIVGAGPAGSFAAEALARGGVHVALFDGRPPGEPKACGGGVTSKALKAWPHLLDAVGRTIDELDMYSPSGKHLHLKLDEPFAVYSRIAFDTFLRERARKAGAKVFSEKISARGFKQIDESWIVTTQSGAEFSASWLVGADGANSAMAKKLAGPLPPAEMEVAFGYRAPLPDDGNAATVVAFLPSWVGYAWAFPRLDHVSFGIATTQDAFDHESLDKLLWDFMVSYYGSYKTARDSERVPHSIM